MSHETVSHNFANSCPQGVTKEHFDAYYGMCVHFAKAGSCPLVRVDQQFWIQLYWLVHQAYLGPPSVEYVYQLVQKWDRWRMDPSERARFEMLMGHNSHPNRESNRYVLLTLSLYRDLAFAFVSLTKICAKIDEWRSFGIDWTPSCWEKFPESLQFDVQHLRNPENLM